MNITLNFFVCANASLESEAEVASKKLMVLENPVYMVFWAAYFFKKFGLSLLYTSWTLPYLES